MCHQIQAVVSNKSRAGAGVRVLFADFAKLWDYIDNIKSLKYWQHVSSMWVCSGVWEDVGVDKTLVARKKHPWSEMFTHVLSHHGEGKKKRSHSTVGIRPGVVCVCVCLCVGVVWTGIVGPTTQLPYHY